MNLVALILKIVTITDPSEEESAADWQTKIFLFSGFLGFFLLIAACYYNKNMYDELRLNYVMAEVDQSGGNNPFFPQSGNPPARGTGNIPPSSNPWGSGNNTNNASSNNRGFQPFQGQGHRL